MNNIHLTPLPLPLSWSLTRQDYLMSQQNMSLDHEVPRELDDTDSFELPQVPESGSGNGEPVTDRPQTQWKPSSRTVEETLADGLSNEDLWMLIRRFNKVRGTGVLQAQDPWG